VKNQIIENLKRQITKLNINEKEKRKGKNMLNPETFSYKPVYRAFPFLNQLNFP